MSAVAKEEPNATYHADLDHLSASGAKAILKSPAYFQHQQSKPMKSDAFDFGTTVHELLLGGDQIEVIDFPDFRSKAAQKARDEARAEGKTPMIARHLNEASKVVAALKEHPIVDALATTAGAIKERSIYWDRWKARPDLYFEGPEVVSMWDLKTTRELIPSNLIKAQADLGKELAQYGYHIQAAIHSAGVEALTGKRVTCNIIWVSKQAPHHVLITELDEAALEVGRRLADRAMRTWQACRESGEWPGVSRDVINIGLPRWAEGMGEDDE